ncbi:bifunctional adenosylcobinamide kinase/adenosylcobinamide-phosphate guanylyltransferase [Alkalihalobacillus sp. TS-13]|uniref:bifunctional adenosylcobinamide kinase/adenosylcobinamide-phosphate guanylyltransferase n=1 Tax=Alkalihalobacillus sp. TS-13 TaxID=2842455 RepID=UPI001C86781A|nr:bifunctional adenosylcobinamide kinase/adenosylcobinamide-phosphate guanylyltransferase [Alkalihalobacillus sp. TS-13]
MHFVTGGAYNGKRTWVKNRYTLSKHSHFHWISAYDGKKLLENPLQINSQLLILEGIELWIKNLILDTDIDETRSRWTEKLTELQKWEYETSKNKVILIGTDISKGIVPLDIKDRTWRDVTGWCYQDTTKKADRVDLIWYGTHQRIK